MESVTVITEPLLHPDFVQFEIVVPILERLRDRYDLTLAAPSVAPLVRERLEARGIRVADGGAHFPPLRRPRDEIPSYVGSWMRDALWGWNRRGIERALSGTPGIRINASMTTAIDADAWLIQSRPLGMALDAMRHGVNGGLLRGAVTAAAPVVGPLDEHHLLEAGRRARTRYATTQHVARWFSSRGLPIEGVLPMYYRPTIHPTTVNPSRDSVLVYVGKETDSAALRLLLETGLPVTMFGSKSVGWVMKALQLHKYPHARLLGYVTDEQLSELYSNARFTAFPFTEEPFGLIPLESMACGTPILTYGIQGPAESVIDGRTGWLVGSPQEFARRAVELWNAGAPAASMVADCRRRARAYHIDSVGSGWNVLFENAVARSGAYPRSGPAGRSLSGWIDRLPPASSRPSSSASTGPTSEFLARRAYDVAPESPGESSGAAPFGRSGGYPAPPEGSVGTWPSLVESSALGERSLALGLDRLESPPGRGGASLPRVTADSPSTATS